MTSQFLTCVFKLHNPSAWRRKVLDHVFEQYTLAKTDLLKWCKLNLGAIQGQGKYEYKRNGKDKSKYTSMSIASCLPKTGGLNVDIASCLKESLIQEVAAGMASYLELEGQEGETGFPTSRDPSPEGWPNALDDLQVVGGSPDDEERAKANLLRQAKSSVVPIPFVRSRDFAILYDVQQDRFFVALKMLPSGHCLGRPLGQQGNLLNLNDDMGPFAARSRIMILVPLEVGRRNGGWHWQYENFLLPTIAGKASIQSAKLMRRENGGAHDYFLHVSFAFDCPDLYKPEAYLGIDKGVLYTMAYGVVDLEGNVIEMGHYDDGLRSLQIATRRRIQKRQQQGQRVTIRDYRGRTHDGILHQLANRIVEKAANHKAQLVVESLNVGVRGGFVTSSWRKLDKILQYKCKLAGVPFGVGVSAAYSSIICIHCGELVERNDRVVTCRRCGAVEHSDDAASVNIARRAMYRKKDWEKKGGYRAFHRSFSNLAGFESENDLRQRVGGIQLALM